MIHLRSLAAFVRDVVAAAVIRHAEIIGRAQVDLDDPVPYVPTDLDLEPEFTDRDYHEAICAAVEAMADERQEDMGRSDFTLWVHEKCAREVEYS